MTTTRIDRSMRREANPPADLRESLGKAILLKLALDAVQCLDESKLNRAVTTQPQFRPQMMLTLLSYCYAARIYGSRGIEWAMRNDPTVRYICARTFPDWTALRHFRRHNRDLVERCLAQVLKKAWAVQFDPLAEGGIACPWPGPELNEEFAAVARDRVEVAIIMDTAESD